MQTELRTEVDRSWRQSNKGWSFFLFNPAKENALGDNKDMLVFLRVRNFVLKKLNAQF